MRDFEQYQNFANQCRISLFNVHIKLQEFELENKEYRRIEGVENFYTWKSEEEKKIKGESCYFQFYLKAWNKGDFKICDIYIDKINSLYPDFN